MQPTLDELWSLPEPMLTDNFDLHGIGGSAEHKLPPLFSSGSTAFLQLHLTCIAAAWQEAAKDKPNSLHLWFHDLQGDQVYLDAQAAFKSDLGSLTIKQYDASGKPVRLTDFISLKFVAANYALDATGGKCAKRYVSFEFEKMIERDIKAG